MTYQPNTSTDPGGVPTPVHVSSWIRYDPDYPDRKLWWECLNDCRRSRDPLWQAHELYIRRNGRLSDGLSANRYVQKMLPERHPRGGLMLNAHFYTFGAWLCSLVAVALIVISTWAGIGFVVCVVGAVILTPSRRRK